MSTYERNTFDVKFYPSFAKEGRVGYNPQITMYYNSSSELIRTEETWRGQTWAQTVSGSTWSGSFPSNWHNNISASKTKVYSAWELTVSGAVPYGGNNIISPMSRDIVDEVDVNN